MRIFLDNVVDWSLHQKVRHSKIVAAIVWYFTFILLFYNIIMDKNVTDNT